MTLPAPSVGRAIGVSLLEFGEVDLQLIEALFPEAAVALEPAVDIAERTGLELAGTVLRILAARDEAGAFEHLEVLGDRGEAHVVRLGQFLDRRFARREPGKDAAAGGVGEGRESDAEFVGLHCSTIRLSTDWL